MRDGDGHAIRILESSDAFGGIAAGRVVIEDTLLEHAATSVELFIAYSRKPTQLLRSSLPIF